MNGQEVVEVKLWGRRMGAVSALPRRPGYFQFQYAPEFIADGLKPAPLMMPLDPRKRYAFPLLNQETYHGLPGLIADALPDKFGNALIDAYMARNGIGAEDVSSLQRLLYIGKRAMGALEFEPALKHANSTGAAMPIEMASLVEDARKAIRGEFSGMAQTIIDIGSSAGGARAKALIGWHRKMNEVVSGQFDLPDGFEHWLLKFDGVGDDGALGKTFGFGRIEYAHHLMALASGIAMSECRLLEENGRAHFMTRRFDRIGNEKLHVQSLCALSHLDFNTPYVHGYEQYFRTILELNLGNRAMEEAWRRCAFNILVRNCDDHTKNLAFLMDGKGKWSLAPAFDMCFAHNPAPGKWTRQHQMTLGGKADGITVDEVIEVGRQFGVRKPREMLDKILEAVRRWPEFGKEAGVPTDELKRIAEFHHPYVR